MDISKYTWTLVEIQTNEHKPTNTHRHSRVDIISKHTWTLVETQTNELRKDRQRRHMDTNEAPRDTHTHTHTFTHGQ